MTSPVRSAPDFRPTAAWETLRLRAELLDETRRVFRAAGYLEVETPILSRDCVIDANIDPFVLSGTGCGSSPLFLQTSPEFHMKRMLASGAEAIWQLSRVFRRGEAGERHNPEFTMLEWYRRGDTHFEQIDFVESLVRAVLRRAVTFRRADPQWSSASAADDVGSLSLEAAPSSDAVAARPSLKSIETWIDDATRWRRLSYDDAFVRFAGQRALKMSTAELARLAERHSLSIPPGLAADDRDGWLNLLLACVVEPRLAEGPPTFLFDYPASQSALAKVRDDDPPVAERFELYLAGVELCNGYHELTGADELRRRNVRQAALRAERGADPIPHDSRLLDAMDEGLPPCAGVALGFDRLAMIAAGASSLAEVIAFPITRA